MNEYGRGDWTVEITSEEPAYAARLRFETAARADAYVRAVVEVATGIGYAFQESRVHSDRKVWWGMEHKPDGRTVKLVRDRTGTAPPAPTRIGRCAHIAAHGVCLACGEPVEESRR